MRDLDLDDLLLLAAEASKREPQEWHDAVKYEVPALVAKVRELQARLREVALVADESNGIDGYHLNGRVASWLELFPWLEEVERDGR